MRKLVEYLRATESGPLEPPRHGHNRLRCVLPNMSIHRMKKWGLDEVTCVCNFKVGIRFKMNKIYFISFPNIWNDGTDWN